LVEIVIPASVEVLGDECFLECTQLESITFESDSRLQKVGQRAFLGIPVSPILPLKKCYIW
jgi:hypothetical protein